MLFVANQISQATDHLVHLWIDTVRNSKLGMSMQGLVVQKWNRQREEEKQRISR